MTPRIMSGPSDYHIEYTGFLLNYSFYGTQFSNLTKDFIDNPYSATKNVYTVSKIYFLTV